MNQKQQEVQQLNQDLLEQRAELAALRSSLDNKEMVRPINTENVINAWSINILLLNISG